MVAATVKKQGRNETCQCGSGLKFKKCCGKVENTVITVKDMIKCLYLLLNGAAVENLAIPKGPIPFSKQLLDEVPEDLVKNILVAENAGFIVLTVKKEPEPIIKVPELYKG